MTRRAQWIWIAAVALLAGGLGIGLYQYRETQTSTVSPEVARRVAAFWQTPFKTLGGETVALQAYRGKVVVVVNFWATWCTTCRTEIPGFMSLQKEMGDERVQFVGLALDDPAPTRQFYAELKMNYPVWLAKDTGFDWLERFSSTSAVPFTLIFDRNGNLRHTALGSLSPEQLRPVLKSLLNPT